jgi:hypothetical protein
MEFQFPGPKELELAREVRIRQKLHRFKEAAQALCGNDVRHRPVMARNGDKLPMLGGANGRGRFPLELLNAVCTFH